MEQNKKIVNKSHSDVLNKEPSCLIIGYGWVGQHINKFFKNAEKYDPKIGLVNPQGKQLKLPGESPEHYKDALKEYGSIWDVAFICVPTPMKKDGSCDTSFVEKAVAQWERWVDLFIIRSTVTPGTTKYLREKYGARVVFQPEYVGETLGHPLVEPRRDGFLILGGKQKHTNLAAEYWSRVMHADCKIRQTDAKTAELCKYMENSFLATKVMFVNDFAKLARAMGLDYLTLREAWLDDPRINRSHTMAYDRNPGFAGKCLPKDLNSIVHYARNVIEQPLRLIEEVLKYNAKMRENIDTEVDLLPRKKHVDKWK